MQDAADAWYRMYMEAFLTERLYCDLPAQYAPDTECVPGAVWPDTKREFERLIEERGATQSGRIVAQFYDLLKGSDFKVDWEEVKSFLETLHMDPYSSLPIR